MNLKIINISNFCIDSNNKVRYLKNYAKFYNELVQHVDSLHIFSGYLREGEMGYEFSFDMVLDERIKLTLTKGNNPETGFFQFLLNYIRYLYKIFLFCFGKVDYFIFLPSTVGIFSVLVILFLNKKKTIGIYIGGNYKEEQKHEIKKSILREKIKSFFANYMDKLVNYAIIQSDYTITSSYEYFYKYKDAYRIYLASPLINVSEVDLYRNVNVNVNSDIKYITFCGDLRPAKGIWDLVRAFEVLKKNYMNDNIKLKIIGNGQAYNELINYLSKSSIINDVYLVGHIKEENRLKDELLNSYIFVLPSYSEGFPRVAYECFTLRIPTILSPVGGISYIIKDKIHSLFVEPGNIQDIVDKINILLNDEILRNNLINNAYNLMKDNIFPRMKKYGSLAQQVYNLINSIKFNKIK